MQSNSTMHQYPPVVGSANGSVVDPQQPLTLPPSPTLTNPDMILPYESERETSTPSPPFEPMQLPSPPDFRHLQDRDNGHQFLHPQSGDQDSSNRTADEIGMAVSLPARQDNKRPNPPRNLWALGGHQVGPPLSDIGEEDASSASSASSPPRSTCSGRENSSSAENESRALARTPVAGSHWNRGGGFSEEADCDGWSDDSSSTVSAHSNNVRLNGLVGSDVDQNGDQHSFRGEDNASQGQIASQGDTAYSDDDNAHYRVNGEGHGNAHRESGNFRRHEEENSMGNIREDKGSEENMDEISSALLSTEAERILENAKKRLTVRLLNVYHS